MDGTWFFGKLALLKNVHPTCLKLPQANRVLKNPTFWTSSYTANPSKQPPSLFFDINGKVDLEKLAWTPSTSAQIPETFDLLWAKPFKDHVFWPQSQKGKILNVQTPPVPAPDELSSPDPSLSQSAQGWNTSTRETLAIDQISSRMRQTYRKFK